MDMHEKINDYCDFKKDETYILLFIARKKENTTQLESEKLRRLKRYTINSYEDIEFALNDFALSAGENPTTQYRVYVSVNPRSLVKGMREFQKRIIDIQFDIINGNEEAYTSLYKLGSEWKSTLAKKSCRARKRFMFDIDLPHDSKFYSDIAKKFKSDVDNVSKVHYFGHSKSGFALVCDPFDIRQIDIPEGIEMKPDAYLYIGGYNF